MYIYVSYTILPTYVTLVPYFCFKKGHWTKKQSEIYKHNLPVKDKDLVRQNDSMKINLGFDVECEEKREEGEKQLLQITQR